MVSETRKDSQIEGFLAKKMTLIKISLLATPLVKDKTILQSMKVLIIETLL